MKTKRSPETSVNIYNLTRLYKTLSTGTPWCLDTLFELQDPEDEDITLSRNVGKYLPFDKT
jgi:hypothetical protein